MTKRVALYLRVSKGEQTVENQRRELAAVAERHGWHIVEAFEDAGISGKHGRDKRPGFDKLLRAIARKQIDLVAAWSVDRLGRSLQDLLGFLGELHAKSVDLYLHQQGLDTSTPAGRAMFQMMGVFAEFERAIIVERVKAGVARARADGKHLGRPKIGEGKKDPRPGLGDALRAEFAAGTSLRQTARRLGVSLSTVKRAAKARQASEAEAAA
jgi:DNA invertase Pin-like site-specific DNA recombinase